MLIILAETQYMKKKFRSTNYDHGGDTWETFTIMAAQCNVQAYHQRCQWTLFFGRRLFAFVFILTKTNARSNYRTRTLAQIDERNIQLFTILKNLHDRVRFNRKQKMTLLLQYKQTKWVTNLKNIFVSSLFLLSYTYLHY